MILFEKLKQNFLQKFCGENKYYYGDWSRKSQMRYHRPLDNVTNVFSTSTSMDSM